MIIFPLYIHDFSATRVLEFKMPNEIKNLKNFKSFKNLLRADAAPNKCGKAQQLCR